MRALLTSLNQPKFYLLAVLVFAIEAGVYWHLGGSFYLRARGWRWLLLHSVILAALLHWHRTISGSNCWVGNTGCRLG